MLTGEHFCFLGYAYILHSESRWAWSSSRDWLSLTAPFQKLRKRILAYSWVLVLTTTELELKAVGGSIY